MYFRTPRAFRSPPDCLARFYFPVCLRHHRRQPDPLQPTIRTTTAKLPRANERYEPLTRGVTPVSVELQKLIDERRTGFVTAVTLAARGQVVFEKACAVCHQREGQGAVVGPQLDDLGTRGLERVI